MHVKVSDYDYREIEPVRSKRGDSGARSCWGELFLSKIRGGAEVSDVTAPMAGKVIEVKVQVGDTVNENDEVLIIEAMKMEMPIVAPVSGKVSEIRCQKGDSVGADDVLVVIE